MTQKHPDRTLFSQKVTENIKKKKIKQLWYCGIDKIRDEGRMGRRSTTVRKTSPGLGNESVWVKHV